MAQRWQYPDLAEPVTVPAPPPAVTFFGAPAPDVVRRPPSITPGDTALVFVDELHRPFHLAWSPSYPGPQPKPPPTHTEPDFTFVDELHREFGLAWLRQQLDPMLPPKQPIHTQPDFGAAPLVPLSWGATAAMVISAGTWQYPAKAEPLVVVPEVITDWLAQHPSPLLPPKRPVHTEPDLVFEDTLFRFFGLAWLPVYPGPGKRPPVTQTEPDFVFEDSLHRLFELAWLGQLPDPTLPPKPRTHTQPDFTFEDALHRPFDIAWWQQGLDPLRPEPRLEPGVVTQPFVEEISLDKWWRQALDPIRFPLGIIAPELAAVFDPSLFPVTWGWLLQHPELLRVLRALQVQQAPVLEVPIVPPTVFLDWLVQHVGQLQRPDGRQHLQAVMPHQIIVPFSWLPYLPDPTRPLPPRQYLYVFVHFPPIYPGVPCVFNPCQYLWQIIYPEDWESCVLPSGFVDVPDPTADPSGYMSSPLVRTPSGFVAAVEAVIPSGYIGPGVQLPTPSGIMTWDQICKELGVASASGYMGPIVVPMPSGYLKRDPHQTPRGPKSPLWDLN